MNYTLNLKCTDVRPGSIIVDIEGDPEKLDDLVQELKTAESFELEGYAKMTIDKVETISAPTKKPATKKPENFEYGSDSMLGHW